jgi:hypothetical protein
MAADNCQKCLNLESRENARKQASGTDMEKLKGTGNTFSTSGKRWLPFKYDPVLCGKMHRLHQLKRKGLTPTTDKASLRQAATEAAACFPIKRY